MRFSHQNLSLRCSDPCNAISFSSDRRMAAAEASTNSPNCRNSGNFFQDLHHQNLNLHHSEVNNRAEEVHVLAVDDSLIDRRVIEKLLRTSAYKVTVVDSGIKALEILGITNDSLSPVNLNLSSNAPDDNSVAIKQEFEFNLIITDYCMPEMTGYDLLKKIKATSTLKEIPVVIMSSENVPNRISSCLAEGAEEFLLKPVQLSDVQRLRGHVKQSSPALNTDEAAAEVASIDENSTSNSMRSKRKKGCEGGEEGAALDQQSQRRSRISLSLSDSSSSSSSTIAS